MGKKARASKSPRVKKRRRYTQIGSRYRCTFVALHSVFEEIQLRDNHVRMLQSTPFWQLFRAFLYKIVKYVKKTDEVSIRVIEQYNRDDRSFTIGRRRIRLEKLDIKLIFGIVDGHRSVKKTCTKKESAQARSSPLVKRRFSDVDSLRSPIIKRALMDAAAGRTQQDETDTVKLLCLYLFSTVLFASATDYIRWGFVNYVEDIGGMLQYDWSAAVLDELMTSIDKAGSDPLKVTGCILALQFWLCEHTTLMDNELQPATHITADDLIPRFVKWNLKKLNRILLNIGLSTLDDNQVKNDELDMTMTEIKLHHVRPKGGLPKRTKAADHFSTADREYVSETDIEGSANNDDERDVTTVSENTVNDIVGDDDEFFDGEVDCKHVSNDTDTAQEEIGGEQSSKDAKTVKDINMVDCTTSEQTHEGDGGNGCKDGTGREDELYNIDINSFWKPELFCTPTQRTQYRPWPDEGTTEQPPNLNFNDNSATTLRRESETRDSQPDQPTKEPCLQTPGVITIGSDTGHRDKGPDIMVDGVREEIESGGIPEYKASSGLEAAQSNEQRFSTHGMDAKLLLTSEAAGTSVGSNEPRSKNRGDQSVDTSQHIRDLKRDNAFLSMQITTLEKEITSLREQYDVLQFESDCEISKIQLENVTLGTEVFILEEDIEKVKQINAESVERVEALVHERDATIESLRIEINRLKALNKQLFVSTSKQLKHQETASPTVVAENPKRKLEDPRSVQADASKVKLKKARVDVPLTERTPMPSYVKRIKNRKRMTVVKEGFDRATQRVGNPSHGTGKCVKTKRGKNIRNHADNMPDNNLVGDEHEVIDVDELNLESVRDPQIILTLLLRSPVYGLLDDSDKERINIVRETGYTLTPVYNKEEGAEYVSMADIYNIILGKEITNNVIDCYVESLMAKQSAGLVESDGDDIPTTSFVFHSLGLHWVRTRQRDYLKNKIDKHLGAPIAKYRYHIYPLLSQGYAKLAKHWTLAVFDTAEHVWRFYNSLRPRTEGTKDQYWNDLQAMKQYIEAYLRRSISEVGADAVQQYLGANAECVLDSPQQATGTLDCGVIVCQLITQIFYNSPITPVYDAAQSRADLVHSILNTPERSLSMDGYRALRDSRRTS